MKATKTKRAVKKSTLATFPEAAKPGIDKKSAISTTSEKSMTAATAYWQMQNIF